MKHLLIIGAGGYRRELLQWVKDINVRQPTFMVRGFLDDDHTPWTAWCATLGGGER